MVLRKSGLLNSMLGQTRRLAWLAVVSPMLLAGPAAAQQHRDFIRQDDEGHLILRFTGTGTNELNADQEEELVNAFVSVMVHDRLRADVLFEAEGVEADWAAPFELRLRRHLDDFESDLQVFDIECRTMTCRVAFLHDEVWNLSEHQTLMSTAQQMLEAFVASRPNHFKTDFLLAGYYQERETQYIKAYINRTSDGSE